jgi:uncharacterized protein (TIGR03382 family)
MASHDWSAMQVRLDPTASAAASLASTATSTVLVDAAPASQKGGCGSAAGFGSGGLLALPALLVAAALWRRSRRGVRP